MDDADQKLGQDLRRILHHVSGQDAGLSSLKNACLCSSF
jgi:hypothetical protein